MSLRGPRRLRRMLCEEHFGAPKNVIAREPVGDRGNLLPRQPLSPQISRRYDPVFLARSQWATAAIFGAITAGRRLIQGHVRRQKTVGDFSPPPTRRSRPATRRPDHPDTIPATSNVIPAKAGIQKS